MAGIDLNQSLVYKCASFRYFEKTEYHVRRFCEDNVLLLVFGGVLRFSEDGEEKEVGAGEYYIQRKNKYQAGDRASDEAKYLYVHFDGEWSDGADGIPPGGTFDPSELFGLMERINAAAHDESSQAERQYLFLKLLLALRRKPFANGTAQELSDYVENNLCRISSLSDLCEALHYSKNYVIRIFNREFGVSPIQYVNDVRIRKAMYLLETTSRPLKEITERCGYADYPYFYKRFVKKTGLSPSQWRRRIREDPRSRP